MLKSRDRKYRSNWHDEIYWYNNKELLQSVPRKQPMLDIGLNRNSGFRILDFFTNKLKYRKSTSKGLEVWQENIDILKTRNRDYEIIKSDVRDIEKHVKANEFQLISWSHGPEHLEKNEAIKVIKILKKLTRKTVMVCCPNGFHDQFSSENPYEKHISSFIKKDFYNLGFVILNEDQLTGKADGSTNIIGVFNK